jgi:hypothetical protein
MPDFAVPDAAGKLVGRRSAKEADYVIRPWIR